MATGMMVDACTLLNLVATERLSDILSDTHLPACIVERVRSEAMYLWSLGLRERPGTRELVDLAPAIATGVLRVIDAQTADEARDFIELALGLDDGEAWTIAVALHRDMIVATDDAKARRLVEQRYPSVGLLRTSQIVKAWAEARRLAPEEVTATLRAIERRATFRPSRNDPLRAWWQRCVAG